VIVDEEFTDVSESGDVKLSVGSESSSAFCGKLNWPSNFELQAVRTTIDRVVTES
tara:strand:+ start:904 stop:1068 length:165 start_codon:yes stop_codon:yes gene_type:complete